MYDSPPDPAKGYVAGIQADAETFPQRRLIDLAAKLGRKVTVNMPGQGEQTFDFTGLGDVEYQKKYADQLVGEMLALQREMGPAYVEQRLAELEAADPEGAAMRHKLWGEIKSGVEQGPTDRPDLRNLEDSIMAELGKGSTLDPSTESEISQGVLGQQVNRGNFLGNAAATQEAGALTRAGEQMQAMRRQQAMQFLTGGLSPEDAAQRERQQGQANLGAFMAGETPIAQFGQVSGAQAGAVPFQGGGYGMGLNPNAGAEGIQFANQAWQLGQQGQGVNPWVAGLSGAFQGANVWASLGGGFKSPAQAPGLQGGWNQGFAGNFAGQA